jgi:hypothetical protein
LISVIQPTQKNYEKDRVELALPLVLSLAAVAAQKKDNIQEVNGIDHE